MARAMSHDRTPAKAGAQLSKEIWTRASAGEQRIRGCAA
jgi:hypothetical protein